MTSTPRSSAPIAEIEIVGSLVRDYLPPGTPIGDGRARVGKVCIAGDVLAAIDRAESSGARVLLLVLELQGGDAELGFTIYNRLRAFSEAGGRVVAFVQGMCGSIGPVVAQAADVVLMRGDGKFAVHGAVTASRAAAEKVDQAVAAVLSRRTGMALDRLQVYASEAEVACLIHDLGAVRLGWADWTPCTIEYARQLASMLARGGVLPETRRSRWLAGLGASEAGCRLEAQGLPELEAGVAAHITGSNESNNFTPSVQDNAMMSRLAMYVASASAWLPFCMPANVAYTGVAESPSIGRLVAVGGTTNGAYSDNAGRTWTATTLPATGGGGWGAVVFAGPAGFLAVGDGVAATSSDGGSWATRSGISTGAWCGVAWNGSVYAAVKSSLSTQVKTSPDGITWTARTLPSSASLYSVTWANGLFVAVGVASGGATIVVMTSPDGTTWTSRTLPDNSSSYQAYAAAWAPFLSTWTIIGTQGIGYTSPDGITWTKYTHGMSALFNPYAVTWGGGAFLAGGSDALGCGLMAISLDGKSWNPVDVSSLRSVLGITWMVGQYGTANRFVFVGQPKTSASDPAGGTTLVFGQ